MRKEDARSLWCPFEARMNPAVLHAHVESRAWGVASGLLDGHGALQRFDAARFAWLIARAYPSARPPELALVSEWNVWLFVHDDGCDADATGRDPDALVRLYRELRAVLHGGPASADADAPTRALADLVPRILGGAPPSWRERFVGVVDDYFAACVWEARNRARNRVPTLAEYIRMRRDTGAVRTSIAMIERCEGIALPDAARDHPIVEALATACNDVVCWANDIISLRKELAQGDVHNLVTVIAHERCPGDLAQAARDAARMHDARVAEFIGLADRVPRFDRETDAQLLRFVDTLRAWMRGNLDWAIESGRYAVGDSLRATG